MYYYPNQPYFQFKGKNKNSFQNAKRQVHRRFALNEWENNPDEEMADKDINRKKFEKQAYASKLIELLDRANSFLKKALLILENEKEDMSIQNLSNMTGIDENDIIYVHHS